MATPPPNSGVRIFPPFIHLAAIAIGFLIQWLLPLHLAHAGSRARLLTLTAGLFFLLIAATLIAWTAVIMHRAGTTPNPTRPSTALLLHGPFVFTRNPMYLAWELICMGVGLTANSPWPILMAFPAAFVTRRLVIDKEERYLTATFGTDYLTYLGTVRRWI